MSIKEEVQEVREKLLTEPYKLVSYRLLADHVTKSYKVVLKYAHVRREAKYVTHELSDHKKIIELAVTAPKTIEITEEDER